MRTLLGEDTGVTAGVAVLLVVSVTWTVVVVVVVVVSVRVLVIVCPGNSEISGMSIKKYETYALVRCTLQNSLTVELSCMS